MHASTTSLKTQQTFGGGGLRGGSHEIFTNREGGSTIFLLLPGGDQKFNRVFHPVSTTPPRELKNDNSLKSHPECMLNLRKFADNYDWSGLEFPVSIKDIREFEINNNILVNVLAVEGRDIYIHRKTNYRCDREINLLLISEDGIKHCTAVKSLSRLLSSSNSKHMHKQYFCTNCLQSFTQKLSRDEHQVYCEDNETIRVEMPRKGSTVEFYDLQNQFKVLFIMYADFEAILEPIQGSIPDPSEPYTSEVSRHIPSGWCVYSKFVYGEVKDPLKLYRGKDCIEKFCNHIK